MSSVYDLLFEKLISKLSFFCHDKLVVFTLRGGYMTLSLNNLA